MEYDIGSSESVSTAVVRAVSAVDGRRPASLPPLTGVLDPDALDALFAPRTDGTPRMNGSLSFVYDYCHVTVDNNDCITIRPLEIGSPSFSDREPTRANR